MSAARLSTPRREGSWQRRLLRLATTALTIGCLIAGVSGAAPAQAETPDGCASFDAGSSSALFNRALALGVAERGVEISTVITLDGGDNPDDTYQCGGAILVTDSLGSYYLAVGMSQSVPPRIGLVAPSKSAPYLDAKVVVWDLASFDPESPVARETRAEVVTGPSAQNSPAAAADSDVACRLTFAVVWYYINQAYGTCASTPPQLRVHCGAVVIVAGGFVGLTVCTSSGTVNVSTRPVGNLTPNAYVEESVLWQNHVNKWAWDFAYVRSLGYCLATETSYCSAFRPNGNTFVAATMHWALASTWQDGVQLYYQCSSRSPTCAGSQVANTTRTVNNWGAQGRVVTRAQGIRVCPDGASGPIMPTGCSESLPGNGAAWNYTYVNSGP